MNVTVPLHDTPSLYFHNALSWAGLLGFGSEQELALHLQNGSGAIFGPSELLEIFSSVVKSDRIEKLIISLQQGPGLRMHGAVPPSTHPCSWCGGDTQEYLFIFTISNASVPIE
jgi:hypothetical protein